MGKGQADVNSAMPLRQCQIGTPLLKPREAGFRPEMNLSRHIMPLCRRNPQDRAITAIPGPTRAALEKRRIDIEIPGAACTVKVTDRQIQPQVDTAVTATCRAKRPVGITQGSKPQAQAVQL